MNKIKTKKLVNNSQRDAFGKALLVCLGAGAVVYAPEIFAASDIAKPLVQTIHKVQRAGEVIGKAITAVSALGCIVMFLLGHPNYKWAVYITLGGGLLAGFSTVVGWLM